jgi:glycosyltransferase involved in cell wall biosynthesis
MTNQKSQKSREMVYIDLTNLFGIRVHSGVESISFSLYEALSQKYDVRCVRYKDGKFITFEFETTIAFEHEIPKSIKVEYFRLLREIFVFLMPSKLRYVLGAMRYVIQRNPIKNFEIESDIPENVTLYIPEIQLNKSHQQAVYALRKRNIKLVYFLHDLIPLIDEAYAPKEISYAFKKYLANLCQSSKIYVSSKFVAAQFVEYFAKVNINIKKQPKILIAYPQSRRRIPPTLDCIDLNLKGTSVLYVSSFIKRKNQISTIRSVAEHALRNKTFLTLVLVGSSGNMVNIIRLYAKRSENEFFKAYVLTAIGECCLTGLYRRADLGIYLSKAEGYGLPVIDALRDNIPVVSSKVPSAIEKLSQRGLFVVELHDEEGIQNALKLALNTQANGDQRLPRSTKMKWPDL